MSADDAMRRRVQGRQDKAAGTAWTLTLPRGMAFRAVLTGEGYVLEMKTGATWQEFEPRAVSKDPQVLLRVIAQAPCTARMMTEEL